jgi:hypothetical protein
MPKHDSFYRSKDDNRIYGVWHGEDLSLDKIMLYCIGTCKNITVSLNDFSNNFIEHDIAI